MKLVMAAGGLSVTDASAAALELQFSVEIKDPQSGFPPAALLICQPTGMD
jgi:hypothetical protein